MNSELAHCEVPLEVEYTILQDGGVMEIFLSVEEDCPFDDETVAATVKNFMSRVLGLAVHLEAEKNGSLEN